MAHSVLGFIIWISAESWYSIRTQGHLNKANDLHENFPTISEHSGLKLEHAWN